METAGRYYGTDESREGVTEELKAKEQWEWIQKMNSIRNQAEEIVRLLSD